MICTGWCKITHHMVPLSGIVFGDLVQMQVLVDKAMNDIVDMISAKESDVMQ